jgi:hypothetical protein
VLLGLNVSMSAISKHTPARVGTDGRKAHMQWLGNSRQPAHRSCLNPPRAMKGLALRARRAVRKRETAWGERPVFISIRTDGAI